MPAKSAAQKRLMDAAAHNPAFAKKVGIPSKVAKDFSEASKGIKFRKGGEMKESKAMMKKEVSFMKAKGAPKSMVKHEEAEMKGYARGGGVEQKGKTKGKMIKMADGGMPPARPAMPDRSNAGGAMRGLARAAAMSGRDFSGMGRPATAGRPVGMKAGGLSAGHKSADGVASKGKTKGKMVAMKKGGKC